MQGISASKTDECYACKRSIHAHSSRVAFVKGHSLSDINLCATLHEITDPDMRAADVHYDRCAPSLLAFAQQSEAADFAREHGSQALAFKDAAAVFAK